MLMLRRELFDCVLIELDAKIKLVRMNAPTRASSQHHQMKVSDWELYLHLSVVLLYLVFIYALFGVLHRLMVWVSDTSSVIYKKTLSSCTG